MKKIYISSIIKIKNNRLKFKNKKRIFGKKRKKGFGLKLILNRSSSRYPFWGILKVISRPRSNREELYFKKFNPKNGISYVAYKTLRGINCEKKN